MADNQSKATADPQMPARPATQPHGSTPGVELDAHAVESEAGALNGEARALEREGGGYLFAGASFDDLPTAAQAMSQLCQALQEEELDDEQRRFLADVVVPKMDELVSSIRDFNQRPGGSQSKRNAEPDAPGAARGNSVQ